jgi:peptidyl-prolyl cis-trans isomerase B (cyclophilin B)
MFPIRGIAHRWDRLCSAAVAGALVIAALAAPVFAQQKLNAPRVDHYVTVETSKGPIVIRVYFSIVPYTAGNFLNLVVRNFYNGLSFHRVENWVVQGGDPNGNGTGNFVDPDSGRPRMLRLETTPRLTHNYAGMVAMARSNDPNSASCQFYILKRPMPQLNGQYAVFGRVVQGMDTVNKISIGDRILSASITDPQQPAESATDRTPANDGQSPGGQPPADANKHSDTGSSEAGF